MTALAMHRIIRDSSSGRGGGGARGKPDLEVFVFVVSLDKAESARQTQRPLPVSINSWLALNLRVIDSEL